MAMVIRGLLPVVLLALLSVVAWDATPSSAADPDDLRAKTQNPVASLISVPFENNLDFGAPNGDVYILNVQPVIPVTLGSWNLINRVIVPIIDVPGFVELAPAIPSGTPGPGATGLGDINYSLFISPADAARVIWGVGPSLVLPTATDDQLGTRKWSAGPTAVVLTQPKPWSLGILARQVWSFAGSDRRSAVSQFLVQPFINFNLADGWFVTSEPVVTADWEGGAGNRWTVPVGGGLGRVFTLGTQPINTRFQAFYNVERPAAGPDWLLRLSIALLFPK